MVSVLNAISGEYLLMNNKKTSNTFLEKAKAAVDKKAALGEDIDLKQYTGTDSEHPYRKDPSDLPREVKERMLGAGVILEDTSQRSGTYLQMDNMPVHHSTAQEGVEVMPVSKALEKYDWMPDYWWKAVSVDQDKYTASVELNNFDGYFIRSLPGQKTYFPVQPAFTWLKKN
jgi:hypothetical protein